MDVTLGVSVAGSDARIALLDAEPPHAVIDQSEFDLTGEPISTLVSTLVSTDRALTDTGHRLVATRVCSSSPQQATELLSALVAADLTDVSVVSAPEAFSAVARSLTPGQTVASLTADADTAALSIVDADSDTTSLIAVEPIHDGDRSSAYRVLLERFNEEPGGATSVIVMGDAAEAATLAETTPIPLTFPDAADFAVARGAALAGFGRRTGSDGVPDLDAAETVLSPQTPQLAYSEVDDDSEVDVFGAADVPMQTPMRPLSEIDPDEVDADEAGADVAARPRVLLLGSTVAAVVVVGFAALAVTVAINIRPTVSEQAIRVQKETVPGKYFPVNPGQGVNKDGENWTMVEKVQPPGTDTGVRTFQAKPLNLSSGTAAMPAPRVIEVFRDGTVGVQAAPTVVPIAPGDINAAGVPGIPEFVPRLIPDFSKVNMNQVLNFLGNMQTQRVIDDPISTATRVVNPVDGMSLDDIGALASVKSTQGELFSAAKPTTGAPDVGVIPQEIFHPDKAAVGAAQEVLPPDTTLLSGLQPAPESGKTGTIPIFGEVLPGLSGTAPNPEGVVPGADVTAPPQGFPLPDLGETLPTPPVVDPKIPGTAPERPNIFPLPIENPLTPKAPEVKPDVPIVKPDPPVFTPPVFNPPKPIFTPPVVAPEEPVLESPPILDSPPIVDSPPPVSIPKPIIELPKIFPIPAAPSVPDPVVEAPADPVTPELPSIPLLPKLPFGGLFGSGQN